MMKVLLYGRVNQKEISVDCQMDRLRSFCRDNGYEVIREITDCCSGSTVGYNLAGLLTDPGRDYDAIVISDPSRISRNTVKLLETVGKMRERGIHLISADGAGYDSIPEALALAGAVC